MNKPMPNHAASVSSSLNTIQAKLEQVRAILSLLFNDGGRGCFDSDHDTVMSAMWSAIELVNGARDCSEQTLTAYAQEHWEPKQPAIPQQP